ncbi:MAG TPA: hypothetical protein VEZ17_12855, partial [Chitinophagaceae bacterium]|nr:hypothetical protein [Chitinophagaceae bacterium]
MKVKFYSVFLPFILAICFSNLGLAQLRQETMQQVQLLLQEKSSRTPAERKIDSRLLQAVREKSGIKLTNGLRLEPVQLPTDAAGNLEVDITANVSDDLLTRMESLGAKIIFPSTEYHSIRALVNMSIIAKIAAYKEVSFIRPAAIAQTGGTVTFDNGKAGKGIGMPGNLTGLLSFKDRSESIRKKLGALLKNKNLFAPAPYIGTVNSEGDRTHRADDARNTFGYEGQGIRIGVLSDSYDSKKEAANDVSTGNLPGTNNPFGNTTPVTVLQDAPNRTDEGRAMLQIIHDLAPKAQLYFATALGGPAAFASAITALRNAPNNCDIIIDDVSYSNEAAFQDDIVALAVNEVTASGALYFSSAGNANSLVKNRSGVWEGDFNDPGSPAFTFPAGAKAGTIHNFGTLAAPVNGNIILQIGSWYNLHWADPLGRSSNDYDLFLVSA